MAPDARSHDLFSRYPDQRVTLPSGRQFSVPYHCYDADTFVLYGTVDLLGSEALLRGENCRPVVIRRAGRPDRGVAQIWLNLYRDTNVGPYQEIVISFSASRERDSLVFTYRNATSLLLPSLDSRCFVFTRWLYLDSELAIDVGREVWGFPKYWAELGFERSESRGRGRSRRTVLVHQTLAADGKEVLRARLELERTPWARLQLAWRLARALGVRRLLALSRERETASALLTPVSIKQLATPIRAVGRSSLHRWSRRNALSFGPETPAGRALAELRFEPALIHSVDALKFAMLPGADLAS
jgi:hypothetical protein